MIRLAPGPVLTASVLLFGTLVTLLAVAVFHARERRRWLAVVVLLLSGVAVAGLLAVTILPVMTASRPAFVFDSHSPLASAAGVEARDCEGVAPREREFALDVSPPPPPEGFEEDWPVPPMGLGPDFDQEIRQAIKSVRKAAVDAGDYCRAWSAHAAAEVSSAGDGAPSIVTIESERDRGSQRDRRQDASARVRATRSTRTVELPAMPAPARRVIGHAAQFFCFSLLLVLAYLFVDAGRRRRYTWLRRFAIAGAFIVACVLIWRSNPLFLV